MVGYDAIEGDVEYSSVGLMEILEIFATQGDFFMEYNH